MNHLVGRKFRVGEATLYGIDFREPCKHLVDVTAIKSLLPTLIYSGGLHAQILGSRLIRGGEVIREVD